MKKIIQQWKLFEERISKALVIKNSHKSQVNISVEIAGDPKSQEIGLQHRMRLGENDGMLFVYERPRMLSFWMKDTFIPLSIAFIDQFGKIISIKHMKPQSEKSVTSDLPCMYALEVNHGWFDKNYISVGNYIRNLP